MQIGFGIVLLLLTLPYLFSAFPWTFIDGANLMFHEAGHFLLAGFGYQMTILGGTLLQLLIPLICTLYFLKSKQFLGFIFGLWWLGVNLVNVGIYMADANTLALPLIGDGTHDWQMLFSIWRLSSMAEIIGNLVRGLGTVMMIAAGVMAVFTGGLHSPKTKTVF
jgi:hypothetical protein